MSEHRETFVIEETLLNERLDVWLSSKYPEVSRGTIVRLIKDGEIRVNDQQVKPNHRPRVGESVSVHFPPPKTPNVKAVEIPLEILYEDGDLLVINKQPGLVVHAASGEEEDTLVNALLHHCDGQLSGIAGVARPGIVHRLDKDTSGCIVSAKNDPTHLELSRQFHDREVEKFYYAITCGAVPNAGGEIDAEIMRHPNHRQVMTVASGGDGKPARTSYRVLRRLRGATWVEAQIHTGRTHQIRVHFKHLGCPLVGDPIYARRPNKALIEETGFSAKRQMLHSTSLTIRHPGNGELMTFKAPLPNDFREALAKLDKDAA
jgi:23S rRNA pseudouridine1911/1915/1917 synthase